MKGPENKGATKFHLVGELRLVVIAAALLPQQGRPLKGYWSVMISGNWRIVFRFEDGDAYEVDLADYH